MAFSSNLGFPRIGFNRELKKSLEEYWSGKSDLEKVLSCGSQIRQQNWKLQKEIGIHHIPSNDFSLYDQVLDTSLVVGAIPHRYEKVKDLNLSDLSFAMARGRQDKNNGSSMAAMEMTKWFDTNYHYIVPEFYKDQTFSLFSTKPIDEFKEALSLGIVTRPVLIGPLSFLLLGKPKDPGFSPLSLLERLLPVYEELLSTLHGAGASWVQLDEPFLSLDRNWEEFAFYEGAYRRLRESSKIKILVATYFEGVRENLKTALSLPVNALHFDLVRAPEQLDAILSLSSNPEVKDKVFSLGVIDGRNIWKNDLEKSLALLEKAKSKIGSERIMVAPSCSLIHTPLDLDLEKSLKNELKEWMSFAKQKLVEVVQLTSALTEGRQQVQEFLEKNRRSKENRKHSSLIHKEEIKKRCAEVTEADSARKSSYRERRKIQSQELNFPLFPTTTIGSFPQTSQVRSTRAKFRHGEISLEAYESFLESEIKKVIQLQTELGIDLLVHGEFERNDMVEYFGEQLSGFVFTENGWVQSYGSRCVKPPIIFGDVEREKPMTVRWSKFAQSQTDKIVKGMLTGPVTILQWSFVRDDQPRSETCKQIALALREEVQDLEEAGIKAIQIDEPAVREGLPLRRSDWSAYLKWATFCFRVTASGVQDETQIHTHMCYSEFNDMIESIAEMDADVISIESSRSQMELLEIFKKFSYPNEIGPGVYDIHSPLIPEEKEIRSLLLKTSSILPPEQLWVNPDCGLKTRSWNEVIPSLKNMVSAAKKMRESFSGVGSTSPKIS